jgi:hypothetical protein
MIRLRGKPPVLNEEQPVHFFIAFGHGFAIAVLEAERRAQNFHT